MRHTRVVAAVNFLIDAPNYSALIAEMTRIIEGWDSHPMTYGGHLKPLNAMLDVGIANRDAFENLIKLIEDKRKLHPKVRRVDYQRDLMRDRRARMSKALDLHELTHGRLRGAARMAEMNAIQARWAEAKHQFLKMQGPLDWKGRNDATQKFWAKIDANLDRNLMAEHRQKVVA